MHKAFEFPGREGTAGGRRPLNLVVSVRFSRIWARLYTVKAELYETSVAQLHEKRSRLDWFSALFAKTSGPL